MGKLHDGRQRKLKEQIAIGQYRVDSSAVAEEILRKMSLIRAARQEIQRLASDRTPRFPAPPRPE
jgi:hypothetical protein